MRFLTVLGICIIGFLTSASGQSISIESTDLPKAGDTFRMSIANNPQVVNLQKTGPDQSWNYESLVSNGAQYVDTYSSMDDVPSTYQILRLFKGANLGYKNLSANPGGDLGGQVSAIPVDNLFEFYRKNSRRFTRVAYGITFSGTGIPAPFNQDDVIYEFPVTYGAQDSSTASLTFPPENLPTPDTLDFYFDRSQKRVNKVDGWGTLTTPYGTFETIRVKSEVTYDDSVYFQGQGQNIPPYTITTYKWLGNNKGAPLLRAQTIGQGADLPISFVTYQDSFRSAPDTSDGNASIARPKANKQSGPSLFPNPTKGQVQVDFPSDWSGQSIRMSIIDINGQAVESHRLGNAQHERSQHSFNLNHLKPGYYLITFQQQEKLLDVSELVIE